MQVIKKTNTRRNRRIALVALAFILIAAGGVFAKIQKLGPFAEANQDTDVTINYDEPTKEQVDAGNDTKKQTALSQGKPSSTSNESNEAPISGIVAIEITNEPQKINGKLSVKTLIQEISSTGTCTLTLSKADQAGIKKTSGVQPLASASTCKLAPIDVSSLSTGSWDLTITYKSNKSNGKVTQKVQL